MAFPALVVEDDPALQLFYQRLLEKVGFQIKLATDGQQALNSLEHDVPYLVILDMRLPLVNGLAVLEYIARSPHLENTHVVIATASQEYERYKVLVKSADFLLKPVMPNQILNIAERIMALHV